MIEFEADGAKYYRPAQPEDLQAKIDELTARIRDLESALAALQVCYSRGFPY
jgi:prefoldin subunit 5